MTRPHRANEEKPTLKQVRGAKRLRHNFTANPIPGAVTHSWVQIQGFLNKGKPKEMHADTVIRMSKLKNP